MSHTQAGSEGFAAAATYCRQQLAEVEQLVEQVIAAAFPPSRTPRSAPYRDGVRAVLRYRALGRRIVIPHAVGTAEADAFFAGVDCGHHLWREQAQAQHAALLKRQAARPGVTVRLRTAAGIAGA
jgi:hypothetical protein